MPRNLLLATAAFALAVGSLTGCRADNHTPSTAATATTPSAPSSTAPAAAPGTSNAPSAKADAKTDLKSSLLTLVDLPTGYAVDRENVSEDPPMSGCTEEAFAMERYRTNAKAKAGVSFSKMSGDSVTQSLTALSDAPDNTLTALRNAVARCTTWTIDKNTFTMTKADYGTYGDETISYRVAVKGELPFAFAMVFIRTANILDAVMVGGVGDAPPRNALVIFKTAAAKLPKR